MVASGRVRIGIVSDLHCNAAGLALAIERMGAIDELWCAGDIVSQSRFSNEIIELLVAHDARCVQGNHDQMLLSAQGVRARSAPQVRSELVDYLAELPQHLEFDIAGTRVLMTHATPFAPHSEYVWAHSRELQRMAEVDADIVILGHTHQAMAVQVGSVLVVNPGSAGQPVNDGTGPALSCAVLDTVTRAFQVESFPCAPPPGTLG